MTKTLEAIIAADTRADKWKRNYEATHRVAKTQLTDCRVSTVRLDFVGGAKPYETVLLGSSLGWDEERYSSVEEALYGHDAMVKQVCQKTGQKVVVQTDKYKGEAEYDDELCFFDGEIFGLGRDIVTFQADDVHGLQAAFEDSITDYEEWKVEKN